MRATRVSLVVLAFAASMSAGVLGQTATRSAFHDYRVVTVVDALVQPWSIAFLPGGDTLITERPGRLRIVRQGKLLPQAVEGVPAGVPLGAGRAAGGDAASELRDPTGCCISATPSRAPRTTNRGRRSFAAGSRTID